MIQNLWGMIKVYCDNNEAELTEMPLDTSHTVIAYRCPHCKNHITISEFEKVVNRISKVLYDAEMNNEIFDLENYKFTIKNIHAEVIKYSQNEIQIKILNKEIFK